MGRGRSIIIYRRYLHSWYLLFMRPGEIAAIESIDVDSWLDAEVHWVLIFINS